MLFLVSMTCTTALDSEKLQSIEDEEILQMTGLRRRLQESDDGPEVEKLIYFLLAFTGLCTVVWMIAGLFWCIFIRDPIRSTSVSTSTDDLVSSTVSVSVVSIPSVVLNSEYPEFLSPPTPEFVSFDSPV